MLIIGEKINSSISAVASAFAKNDKWFIQQLAIAQIEAGANSLDLNTRSFLEREQDQLSSGKVRPAQKADINQAFAVALLALDTLFVDPLDKRLMSLLSATQVI